MKEEIARIKQKIKSGEKELEKKKEEQKKQAKEIAKLQRDLEDVTVSRDELNEQQDKEGGGRLHLAESQLKEYNRMYAHMCHALSFGFSSIYGSIAFVRHL